MKSEVKLPEALESEREEEVEHDPISQSSDESEEEDEEIHRIVQEEREKLEERNKEQCNELKILREIL